MSAESQIPAPVNPLTIKINMAILSYVLGNFMQKYLPTFKRFTTSDVRTATHNAEVGGVPNSAHVHGLAEDFQLMIGNSPASEAQAKAAWEQFIKPNWPGFTEFEASHGNEGYHIHVQLSREISTYAGVATMAGLGVLGFVVISNWGKKA
jgi:hypothetical protein